MNALDCTRAQIPAASRERLGEARAREIFRHQFKLVMGRTDGSGQFMGMKEGGGGGVGIRRPDRRPRWPGRLSCSDSFAFAVGKKRELSEGGLSSLPTLSRNNGDTRDERSYNI